jgi:hypothetical protein
MEAEAYQAGIPERVPPELTVEERIKLGKEYIKNNPGRFKGLNAMGKATNGVCAVATAVSVVKEVIDEAPIAGHPRMVAGYEIVYLEDTKGEYRVDALEYSFGPIVYKTTYRKVYTNGDVENITYDQYQTYQQEVRRFYGYWYFDIWTLSKKFMPGLLRQEPPVRIETWPRPEDWA